MVLDTSVIIEFLRARPSAAGRACVDAVRSLVAAGEMLSTTRLNIAELYVGLELARDRDSEERKLLRFLTSFSVLDFDDNSARVYGELAAVQRRAGRLCGDMDILIASVALAHGQVLATRNAKHVDGLPGLVVFAM